jgi:phosphomannomutase
MENNIKFGTDGWRAIIAETYTVENVMRVSYATAAWLKKKYHNPSICIGYDCRFGGEMFASYAARVLASSGIKVYMSHEFATTPMVSLSALKLNTQLGVVITASHNPPSYNGYKLKASYGGPLSPQHIEEVEALIPEKADSQIKTMAELVQEGMIEMVDMEKMYIDHVFENFDIDNILSISNGLMYDAMYGAGQKVVKKLLPNAHLIHCDFNPSFYGVAPEPILKNLTEISSMIETTHGLMAGLATDGDADRIGFFDGKGRFIDSHHLILLVTYYLVTYKGYSGKVVKSFSVSSKVEALAKRLGLETITTKIGFKYICEHMVEDDVLIGAEESGGIAIKGHIPERDGIWIGLVLLEYMAQTGKSVEELVSDMYAMVGPFAVERYDLTLTNSLKEAIMEKCQSGFYQQFGSYKVLKTEDMDGFKFHLPGDEWVMIRASGTEPVLRVYAESFNSKGAFAILDEVKATILG